MEITNTEYKYIENERYNIRDCEIKDDKDNVIATICFSKLHPGKSTRGHVDSHNELYVFIDGKAVMMIDKELHSVKPSPGQSVHIFVKRGQFHKVLNDTSLPLEFLSIVPGKVMRMPYQNPQEAAEIGYPGPLGSKQD
jgi:oxalate decarboxylase/phosphoglucose isomerase-like protein (cupin superfamily)